MSKYSAEATISLGQKIDEMERIVKEERELLRALLLVIDTTNAALNRKAYPTAYDSAEAWRTVLRAREEIKLP